MDYSLQGSSVHGILQVRILEWGAISFSRGSSRPRDWIQVFCIAGRHFNLWATREALYLHISLAAAAAAKSHQSCPIPCDPIDGSTPGSPVPGILQARTLEWVAISFSNAWKWKVKVKSCPTPIYPMDCSPPGSSVHGIFQARVLEWGAIVPQYAHMCNMCPGGGHSHPL